MATANLSILPAGSPALSSGTVVANPVLQEPAAVGTFSLTNTGTATDTINFIDGTLSLGFTPSAVIVFRTGGTAAATISAASVSNITATSCVVNWSATPVASTTLSGVVLIFR